MFFNRLFTRAFISLILLILFAGCSSSHGIKVTSDVYDKIKLNDTTKEQLVEMLGPPQSEMDEVITKKAVEDLRVPKSCGVGGETVKTLSYNYTHAESSKSSIEVKMFVINNLGKVCHKTSMKHGI